MPTFPSKINHSYGIRDMYLAYKKGCWQKYRESKSKDKRWKVRLDYNTYKAIIKELWDNVEDNIFENKPVLIPKLGKFYLRKHKASTEFARHSAVPKARLTMKMPFWKKHWYRIRWDKTDCTIPNAKYYKFRTKSDTPGKGKDRLKKKR